MSPPHLSEHYVLFYSPLQHFFPSSDHKTTHQTYEHIFYTGKFMLIPASKLFQLQADDSLLSQIPGKAASIPWESSIRSLRKQSDAPALRKVVNCPHFPG